MSISELDVFLFQLLTWGSVSMSFMIPTFQPSLPAFAGIQCPAKVLAQHPRECHPFSVLMDQDLLKLSHLGEFHQGCEAESWINPSPQCVCCGESWEFSLELSLPETGLCIAAPAPACSAMRCLQLQRQQGCSGWGELWGQAFSSITLLLNQPLSCCSLEREVGWLVWVQDIPLSLLPTKTVLGLTGLILNGLGCENLSSWDDRLEGGV